VKRGEHLKKALYLFVLVPFIMLLLSVPAKAAQPISYTPFDAGGSDLELDIELVYTSDIVNSGSAIPIAVEVKDDHGVPVKDALVLVKSSPAVFEPFEMSTDENGRVWMEFTANTDFERNVEIIFSVSKQGCTDIDAKLVVTVFPMQDGIYGKDISLAFGAFVAATFLSTEAGKYGMFKSLMFPLYTRLKKNEVLDHFVRGQIYGYIMSHPGRNYNAIRNDLDITNGTLSHHLRTLEVQGFIKSRRDGVNTRFYPIDMKIPQEKGTRLSDLQMRIIELISTEEGMTQVDIAERLDVSQQCISYNLKHMKREGIIGIERIGRVRRYFLMDT
jgi:DNA-binding MarR family transcriptional regulator